MSAYTFTSVNSLVVRGYDGAIVPWDPIDNRPADMAGLSGRMWIADGSPGALSPAPTQSELAASLSGAASAAADFLLTQVAPDRPHLVAYQNAAAVAAANGGSAPTVDPLKSAFASQAAAFGYTPADFATLTMAISAASMSLSAALATLQGSAQSASTAADLATALTAFEQAIDALVAGLNSSGLKVTVVAPSPISISGINA